MSKIYSTVFALFLFFVVFCCYIFLFLNTWEIKSFGDKDLNKESTKMAISPDMMQEILSQQKEQF